jgi:4-hydroxyphenylpyruvate dioxygenase
MQRGISEFSHRVTFGRSLIVFGMTLPLRFDLLALDSTVPKQEQVHMQNKTSNPCGLNGFSFLEFSAPTPELLEHYFTAFGFKPVAAHITQAITRYEQGEIIFILNATESSQAYRHAQMHGPGACAMGFKVNDATAAFNYALANGATAFDDDNDVRHGVPAIVGIGGSVIYLVEDKHPVFEQQWTPTAKQSKIVPTGLQTIDHLTHNVYRGQMDQWANFYERIFNFHEIRFFDIKGQSTGLISRALSSPCGKIKIPLNESKDDVSQIEEFLHEYHGEGIQHIALSTENIYDTVHALRDNGIDFLEVPDTYYDMIDQRIPWHQEPLDRLKAERLLIDGERDSSQGLLLQLFTKNAFGPVFFEIIQRRGNQGFGEGNFTALFEAIERDQIKRGVL